MADEFKEILLIEREVPRPTFPQIPGVHPASAQAHYFLGVVADAVEKLHRREGWEMLAPHFDAAVSFKLVLVRKKERPGG
jgi:hypothetical protein